MPIGVVCSCHDCTAVVIIPKLAVVPSIVEFYIAVNEAVVELLEIVLTIVSVTVIIMVVGSVIPNNI